MALFFSAAYSPVGANEAAAVAVMNPRRVSEVFMRAPILNYPEYCARKDSPRGFLSTRGELSDYCSVNYFTVSTPRIRIWWPGKVQTYG